MIDLRSDTVTRPTHAMRQCMASAAVGDDVWGDDPSVNELETLAAAMLGKEAALFAPSGTQSNLVALMAHCRRGDEYIVGQEAHTYKYEGGGAAVLGSIQPQPLAMAPDGTIPLESIRAAIKPRDIYFAVTRLFCLENTTAGRVLPLDYVAGACELAASHGLGRHLDGARVFNAAVKLGVDVREIARHFDSVSVCLSKGLGAPVGSVLCGSAGLVEEARRWRKMLGGGMRQAGIVAAAGIHALRHNVERLREDHEHAALLAQELAGIAQLRLDLDMVQTNMVFVTPPAGMADALADHLEARGILVFRGATLRLVTHLHITRTDILRTVAACKDFFRSCGTARSAATQSIGGYGLV